jgi:hypothetical protein
VAAAANSAVDFSDRQQTLSIWAFPFRPARVNSGEHYLNGPENHDMDNRNLVPRRPTMRFRRSSSQKNTGKTFRTQVCHMLGFQGGQLVSFHQFVADNFQLQAVMPTDGSASADGS